MLMETCTKTEKKILNYFIFTLETLLALSINSLSFPSWKLFRYTSLSCTLRTSVNVSPNRLYSVTTFNSGVFDFFVISIASSPYSTKPESTVIFQPFLSILQTRILKFIYLGLTWLSKHCTTYIMPSSFKGRGN